MHIRKARNCMGLFLVIFLNACDGPANRVGGDASSGKLPAEAPSQDEASQVLQRPKEFELSSFCLAYHCSFEKSWPLKTGATNFTYKTMLDDTIVEVQTREAQISGLGLSFPTGHSLTKDDYRAIAFLVNITDPKHDHSAVLPFIRKNIASSVCNDCSVPIDAAYMRDGNFRVAAGSSGAPVLSLERVDSERQLGPGTAVQISKELQKVNGDYSAAAHMSPTAETKLRACDKEVARQTLRDVSEFAILKEQGGAASYKFRPNGWSAIEPVVNSLASAIADADACTHQSARSLTFYNPNGTIVGTADPVHGITFGTPSK
jgi:hypothetical protein